MTIKNIFLDFKWRFSLTLFLLLTESGLMILFPLFIGFAIDDALIGSYKGSFYLGGLGLALLIFAGGRRLFDSRFYAKVYRKYGLKVGTSDKVSSSQKAARLHMLTEVVEFFENSMPALIASIIGLVGTLIIVAALNTKIFLGCLVLLVFTFIIYALTSKKTTRFNSELNNEIEKQVDVVATNEVPKISTHLKDLMKWNIKLSDLEMINFSVVWTGMMGFLVVAIMWSVEGDDPQYGAVFALVMYIFQYIESLIGLPLFYQQWLRLAEISNRLKGIDED